MQETAHTMPSFQLFTFQNNGGFREAVRSFKQLAFCLQLGRTGGQWRMIQWVDRLPLTRGRRVLSGDSLPVTSIIWELFPASNILFFALRRGSTQRRDLQPAAGGDSCIWDQIVLDSICLEEPRFVAPKLFVFHEVTPTFRGWLIQSCAHFFRDSFTDFQEL